MTKDKDLEELFLAQKPTFDDGAEFMAKLTKRLDAVEYFKQYQERILRRNRIVMVAAFVVGILSGAVSTAWLLSSPIDTSLFDIQAPTGLLLWFVRNSRVLACVCLSTLMVFCTIAFVNNILDIMDMRLKIKEMHIRAGKR